MNLDRGLIKSQAKELIRGKVMKLFLTSLVIELCIAVSALPFGIYGITHENSYDFFDSYGNYFDSFDEDFNRYDYEYDEDDYFNQYQDNFENFGSENNSGKSDFYNYGTNFVPTSAQPKANAAASNSVQLLTQTGLYYLTMALELVLMPLTVSLAYYFVLFIRGKEFSGIDGIKFIFKETFSQNYGKKLGTAILRGIFIYLLSLLFFIPGIIFHYSSYFAYQIICDNPQLSPMQAIKISKKMIKGNRTELFVLDLSFIPWVLLCVFIFPVIYVMPYMQTTQALYYENFRLRAIAQGRVTEDDFLTDAQKMQKYAQQNSGAYQANPNQQQGYAQAAPNAYQYAPQNAGYYTSPQQNAYTAPQGGYAAPQQNAPYTAPPVNNAPQSNVYTAAQENTYTAPKAEPAPSPAPMAEPAPSADEAEEQMPAEEVKPSEKYTPVTPPTENYNNTEE